ncbi:MAG: hypothetical protein JRI68_25435, partial [Deltaproteobacteria bacterium]|nr:hypothetical protein [Deltaproteobacteria bacterium]
MRGMAIGGLLTIVLACWSCGDDQVEHSDGCDPSEAEGIDCIDVCGGMYSPACVNGSWTCGDPGSGGCGAGGSGGIGGEAGGGGDSGGGGAGGSGGAPAAAEVLVTDQNYPSSIAVDDTHVYWCNHGTGEVRKVPKDGGSAVTLVTGQLEPASLAVDGTN